jgi:hypothetical protein
MGFQVIETLCGRYSVLTDGEPSWLIGLSSLSDTIWADLNHQPALVIAFSIWSTADRDTAYDAILVAKSLKLQVPIGLLPVDDPSELTSWLSPARTGVMACKVQVRSTSPKTIVVSQAIGASPLWFLVQDNTVQLRLTGRPSQTEIANLVCELAERLANRCDRLQ